MNERRGGKVARDSMRTGIRTAITAVAALVLIAATGPAHAGLFDWWTPQPDVVSTDDGAMAQVVKRKHASKPAAKHGKKPQPDIARIPPGPMQIVISLAKQKLVLYSNGRPVAEAPVSTGVPGHPTPMGVFSVIAKSRHHASNIYSGAPMPYMQRITWSGIALHEGVLPGRPASHGCIRMPGSFASRLFAASKLGARVIIARDLATPFDIDSPRLVALEKPAAKPVEVAAAQPAAADGTGASPSTLSDAPRDNLAVGKTAEVKTAEVKTAEIKPAEVTGAIMAPSTDVIADPKPAPQRKGPIQLFVSRKQGKLFARQGFAPLFEMPVTIADADKPWGTHVYTVIAMTDGKARWNAITIPSGYASDTHGKKVGSKGRKLSAREIERQAKRASDLANAPSAAEALERFAIPDDAVERIAPLLAAGSALIVSDNAMSEETGLETDFIVATH